MKIIGKTQVEIATYAEQNVVQVLIMEFVLIVEIQITSIGFTKGWNKLKMRRLKAAFTRFKKWNTVDHWVDLIVDIGLIAFDVLSSPILIVVRFFRYYFNKLVNGYIKRFLKWVVKKILRRKTDETNI